MTTKEQIKQKIQKERGEYTHDRFKKFQFLKNTNQLGKYYLQKRGFKKAIIKPKEEVKLNWLEKLIVFIKALFKTLTLRTAR